MMKHLIRLNLQCYKLSKQVTFFVLGINKFQKYYRKETFKRFRIKKIK